MNSTSNPYPSYHDDIVEQSVLEWEAYQHTTILGTSSQLEHDQDWISQQLKALMVVSSHIDTKLRELQDLYHKQQDILRAFNVTTTTSTWNIPPSTSSSQTVTHPPPAHYRADKKAFGYNTSRTGEVTWHRETLERAKKNHICHCGKGYTRKDSLLRHVAIHASENPYIV